MRRLLRGERRWRVHWLTGGDARTSRSRHPPIPGNKRKSRRSFVALGASRTVLINLRRRKDRKKAAERELMRLGAAGYDNDCEILVADPPSEAAGFPSIGAHGCFQSHLEALKGSIGCASLLILEDDIRFNLDAAGDARGAFSKSTPAWDIFYGGYVFAPGFAAPDDSGLVPIGPDIELRQAHCAGFSGAVIPALVDYLEAIKRRPPGDPAGGPMHVDGAYNRFRRDNPDLRAVICAPAFGLQRSSRSDIAPNRGFDRMPVARETAELLRGIKDRIRPAGVRSI